MEGSDPDFLRAYDVQASEALRRLDNVAAELAQPLIQQFYQSLPRSSPVAEVIARLTPEEFEDLKTSQVEYLVMLVSSTLTFSTHQSQARRAGRTHALVGADIQWLVEALVIFQSGVERRLLDLPAHEREPVQRAVSLRILADLHEQVAAEQQGLGGDRCAVVVARVQHHHGVGYGF